jgi:hypothetical protein
MKVIRYQVKPEYVTENERLITDVFRELNATRPSATRYLVLALGDGTFIHIAEGEMTTLESHRKFRSGIDARCLETPHAVDAKVVGEWTHSSRGGSE